MFFFFEPKMNVLEQEEGKERDGGGWAQTFRDVFARHGKQDGIGVTIVIPFVVLVERQ